MEITKGIHLVKVPIPDNPLGFLNCYLIAGKDGWLMIDTGWNTHQALEALKTGLKGLGLTFADIAIIVVTHVHPDHFGLAGRLKQLCPNARLLIHHWESALIESRYMKFGDLLRLMGIMLRRYGVPESEVHDLEIASMPAMEFVTIAMPDEFIYGGEIINTGLYRLETIWTPGHSPGHICLYEPQHKLLFSGDHILPTITPNISSHVQSGDNPLGDYINALQKLRNLEVTKVLPAHEYIFTDLKSRITEIFKHHESRKEEIRHIVHDKSISAYEIASRIRWDIPGLTWKKFSSHLQRYAITETIAHLECMRREGTIVRIDSGDQFLHRLAQ